MKPINLLAITSVVAVALLSSAATFANSKAEIDASVIESLNQFHLLNKNNEILERKAAGVLVFPKVTKGGVGVAGEYGEGVLQVKGRTVGYYNVASASVGLTLGAAKRSENILFMTQESLDKFTNSKGWSVGADTGVALISMGAGADYDTQTMKKPILGFVYGEKGLIADLSIEGSKINKIER